MSRPKRLQTSADIAAEIRRLEEERQRAIVAEDQRRGALLREYLGGPHGRAIRAALAPAIGSRDAYLFEFASGTDAAEAATIPEAVALADGGPRRPGTAAASGSSSTRRDTSASAAATLPA